MHGRVYGSGVMKLHEWSIQSNYESHDAFPSTQVFFSLWIAFAEFASYHFTIRQHSQTTQWHHACHPRNSCFYSQHISPLRMHFLPPSLTTVDLLRPCLGWLQLLKIPELQSRRWRLEIRSLPLRWRKDRKSWDLWVISPPSFSGIFIVIFETWKEMGKVFINSRFSSFLSSSFTSLETIWHKTITAKSQRVST